MTCPYRRMNNLALPPGLGRTAVPEPATHFEPLRTDLAVVPPYCSSELRRSSSGPQTGPSSN